MKGKVVYDDGGEVRAIKGDIADGDNFVRIRRVDGLLVKINKKQILKIESR